MNMQTLDETLIQKAARFIKEGKLIIFPTDTVYGLAAAMDKKALEKLYQVKGRSSAKPVAVLVSSKDMVDRLPVNKTPVFARLIDRYWPGPLTIVFDRTDGSGTLALRQPDSHIALSIIEASGGALYVTSANKSNHAAAVSAKEAQAAFEGKVDLIIDGGPCRLKKDSTVVKMADSALEVLREGTIKKSEITAFLEGKNE